jgi:hypothetical protein
MNTHKGFTTHAGSSALRAARKHIRQVNNMKLAEMMNEEVEGAYAEYMRRKNKVRRSK